MMDLHEDVIGWKPPLQNFARQAVISISFLVSRYLETYPFW